MIVVFGSINIDQVYQMQSLPKAGETIHGTGYVQVPGGKGANQALAARRSGAKVRMVGCVGEDANAEPVLSLMQQDGVGLEAVTNNSKPTGCASIWVDGAGENSIVVVAGANGAANADQVTDSLLQRTDYLLMQMEVPAAENWKLIKRATLTKTKTMLNLAPVFDVPIDVLHDLDYLIVNEVEASALAEQQGLSTLEGTHLAMEIAAKFDLCFVLTLGGKGAIAVQSGQLVEATAMNITPVDTTAAGDSFIGGFATALSEGRDLGGALQFATITAGLTCQKAGAQTSLPDRDAINEAYRRL